MFYDGTDGVKTPSVDVEGMVTGSGSNISSIYMLNFDNRKVLDSASDISVHVNELYSSMQELTAITADYEDN